jgi:hypothetical protein
MTAMKHPRMHEWAWGYAGIRTVCGLQPTQQVGVAGAPRANLAGATVHDLGAVDAPNRCRNCERMRSAIGTSRKPVEATP